MNSRQRLWTTLNHAEPDRVPFDMGATSVTGIHAHAYRRLRARLGLPEREITTIDVFQQLAQVDEDAADGLEIDVRSASLRPMAAHSIRFEDDGEYVLAYDAFSIGRRMPKDGGLYYDLAVHPLAGDISPSSVDRHLWPDPVDPRRFEGLRDRAEDIAIRQGRAVAVGSLCAGIMEMHAFLRGYQDFYLDLAANHELAGKIMDKILEMKLAYWEKVFDILGDLVDVVQEADDMAGQEAMLISPRTYRKLAKPRHKELFDYIHSRSRAKIFFHSCGAVRPVIPDLIEVGVDILNPVQVSAKGMDTAELKREFGKDLVFWGGGVDTQRILGSGTPAEVREEVKRRVDDLMPGGGFVFATVHNTQADVPPENLCAMWEALREAGRYSA